LARLRHKAGAEILIATTHLKAGKGVENEVVRNQQTNQLLRIVQEKQHQLQRQLPVVLLGDLNSDPREDDSCVRNIAASNSDSDSGGFGFRSAYDNDDNSGGVAFTTLKVRGDKATKRTIDYIFYSSNDNNSNDDETKAPSSVSLHCTHRLSLPKEHEMEPTLLPGLKYPSDHFAIAAKFDILRK
jgi:endonuclease/exonuclease/phosphatase family metal-dependent hydrolase